MQIKSHTVKEIIYIGILIAILSVAAHIKFQFFAVPFTLQFFVVFLLSLIFPTRIAFESILLYLLLGLIGFPIFTYGGGFWYVLQPSFGFLLGFLAVPIVMAYTKPSSLLFACMVAYLSLYVLGLIYALIWMTQIAEQSFTLISFLGMFYFPFIPSDGLSIFMAYRFSKRVKKQISL